MPLQSGEIIFHHQSNLPSHLAISLDRPLRHVPLIEVLSRNAVGVSNEHDRTNAIESYRKYLEFGGPFANAAQEGLTRLEWTPKY